VREPIRILQNPGCSHRAAKGQCAALHSSMRPGAAISRQEGRYAARS
jgi:hypothetical protein